MFRTWLLSVSPIGLAVSGVAYAQGAPIETPDDDNAAVPEIVVVAQKRSQSLQSVPQAISVVNGELAEVRGQTGLADLQVSVPNLTFAATQNMAQFFLRGVGTTFINGGGDPGVSFHQDDVYVSDMTTINTAMFDIDHVEVLRGPQGALYGRNAVGGSINVLSAKPTSSFTAKARAEVGDYGRFMSEGAVSGPLGFADTDIRIAYQVQNRGGYTKNLLAGQPGAPDKLDDLHSNAFRVYTLTNFASGGTFSVIYTHYNEKENGPALAVKPMPGQVTATQAGFGVVPTDDPRATSAQYGDYRIKADNINVRLDQPVGDMTLTATGNYRSASQRMLNDCDGTPAPGCRYFRPTSTDDYFADLHLASPDDARLRWLVGASYLEFDLSQRNFVEPFTFVGQAALVNGGELNTNSWAVYTDLRYQLTESIAINAQVRYNETKKSATQLFSFEIPSIGVDIDVQDYTGPGSTLKNTGTPFKIGAEFQVTPDVMLYGSFATAQKDGAINLGALQPQPVKQEKVETFEIGEKASFFNRRLVVNSAVFTSKYKNLQISKIEGQQTVLTNVPKSTISGAELELKAIPLDGLRLGLTGGYLDGTIEEFENTPPGGNELIELNGNRLPYVAKWNVTVDAGYEFDLADALTMSLDVQYSWKDKFFFTEFNQPFDSQPSAGTWNLFASVKPFDGPWKIYGFVQNLTDKTSKSGETIYSNAGGSARAFSYTPPRHFAVGVAVDF